MQRLQNRPFALRSRVRGEVNRLCGAGRVRAGGDRLKRSAPTVALRQKEHVGGNDPGLGAGPFRDTTGRDA